LYDGQTPSKAEETVRYKLREKKNIKHIISITQKISVEIKGSIKYQ